MRKRQWRRRTRLLHTSTHANLNRTAGFVSCSYIRDADFVSLRQLIRDDVTVLYHLPCLVFASEQTWMMIYATALFVNKICAWSYQTYVLLIFNCSALWSWVLLVFLCDVELTCLRFERKFFCGRMQLYTFGFASLLLCCADMYRISLWWSKFRKSHLVSPRLWCIFNAIFLSGLLTWHDILFGFMTWHDISSYVHACFHFIHSQINPCVTPFRSRILKMTINK